MNSYFMIQRKNQTILTDVNEYKSVHALKKMIAGVVKAPPENQRMFYRGMILDDTKSLSDCGLDSTVAMTYNPAPIGLVLKMESGEFEPLEITAFSPPVDLLQYMKDLETNGRDSPI